MILKMQLCAGRHDCPDAVDGAIFPETVTNIHDYDALYKTVEANVNYKCDRLIVYVTGLTPCLCAVVKYCHFWGINLVCAHYDREDGTYKEQRVL